MPEIDTDSDDGDWEYALTVPNDARAVPIGRRTLRLILTAHGLPHLAEAAELIATELVANAVQHTKGPAALRLRWSARTWVLRIGVWDTDPTPPSLTPAPTAATALDSSGRGLALVREEADTWGWYGLGRAQPPYTGGKFVWCELTRAA
ncbi:ATP-binding protein [Streptomyces beihaiensis]|uniref:ATP-binding protein n=1 Tax=Streptomyces beihaiensis TaxID=2984495 RepID=A0ABT3U149_9ACTN|nr:ATP-binding protein [Streptomyces beihaiensis]MCX3062337.1 ATP-binding protein [Streptomyces beihaiensis]